MRLFVIGLSSFLFFSLTELLPALRRQQNTTWELGDIEAFMTRSSEQGREWDFVVLDPPKLAPSRKDLDRAARKYTRLNCLALRLVRRGGVLLTCSCSGAVTQVEGS